MKKAIVISLVATLTLFLSACGSDDNDDSGSDVDNPNAVTGSTGGTTSTGGPEFDACLEAVEPTCDVHETDTAEKLETPCFEHTFLAVPLTNGDTYGPMTIPGGPYGSKIEWNEGAGSGFENTISAAEFICNPMGIDMFAEPSAVTDDLKNVRDMDQALYTVFRPACMKEGETYPVITWANGTCGYTHGYAILLNIIASYGYVIFATNSTMTGTTSTNGVPVMLNALNYAEYVNDDPNSIFYQKLDFTKVGAMGHSQGSMATSTAASDPRIKALILWNGGTSNDKPFLYVSAERDVMPSTPDSMASSTNAATQPGAWLYHHQVLETGGTSTGHLVLMEQPERVVDMAVAWWDFMLKDDPTAKAMFVGPDCGLCNSPDEYEYGHNSLLN